MLKTQLPGDGRNPIVGSEIRPGVETGGLDQGGRVDQGRAVRTGKLSVCAAGMHKARSLPLDQFKRGVDQHLTGRDSKPT